MTYLDFASVRDADSTSWTRANPDRALIEQRGPTTFIVMLRDGAAAHDVTYGLERGARVGFCDCDGYKYSDESVPCAHLCVLRKAEFIGATSVDGERIEAVDTAVLAETDTDPGLRADGGPRREPSYDPDDVETIERPDHVAPEERWTNQ
ncbi:hypothetical protein J2752_001960 [Halarchaeum rubridurum]|uniref:SWIM-type domain-containing protein n=1 Tax=Halarchaeum rubridurum TaxID=489911 RepID=A0A830G0G9_9EURY|nr:hypothetical protein [Halarchaeum rubridurum]MBP1955048.1 hypothetical protein [Halarchaeum rubridurum]GGM69367.1 hypothetical protein GCM10009017_19450 [Halarchaeum rubridurum]